MNKKVVTVISVYAPQSGRSEEEKEKFYEDLTAEVQSRHGISLVSGDFNRHVGRSSLGYDEFMVDLVGVSATEIVKGS